MCRKHPDPTVPPRSALIESNNLPALENVEVTGNIIQRVGSAIQGSAGPCGCDASYWQDALLRCGAHSSHLRDAVASLAQRLCNGLVPWSEIMCLLENKLLTLDKSPGARPIGIGEVLWCVIGEAVGLVTRYDVEDISM